MEKTLIIFTSFIVFVAGQSKFGTRPPIQLEEETDCYTGNGTKYFGTTSISTTGKNCQRWDDNKLVYDVTEELKNPQGVHGKTPIVQEDPIVDRSFPKDYTVKDASNFCRNPDNDPKGPWCYTRYRKQSSAQYCNISKCDTDKVMSTVTIQLPERTVEVSRELQKDQQLQMDEEDCYEDNGSEYSGSEKTAANGASCQLWSDSRGVYIHSKEARLRGIKNDEDPINDRAFPDDTVADAGSFCRNPDKDPKGPWCYTEYRVGSSKSYCNLASCTLSAASWCLKSSFLCQSLCAISVSFIISLFQ